MKSLNASAENDKIPCGLSLVVSHGFTQEYNINVWKVLNGKKLSADTLYAENWLNINVYYLMINFIMKTD